MPSYAQLEQEIWWGREIVSAQLDWLGDRYCEHFGRPRSAAGSKGDNQHLRGAHRSQEWIQHSTYCTSRTYTVQSGLTSHQLRLIAGFDSIPAEWGTALNRQLVAEQTRRLVDAAKAGRLNGVIEIGGTLNGRTPFGWHVTRGVELSFDDSHVDHGHLTFDRHQLESQTVVENVFAVIIGDDMALEGLDRAQVNNAERDAQAIREMRDYSIGISNTQTSADQPHRFVIAFKQLLVDVAELKDRPPIQPAPVDPAVIAAAVKAAITDPAVLTAIAKAVLAETARELTD